jgi:deoxyribodipyrimidine photo-lyase
MRTVVWFRDRDLRVHDHEPLLDAAAGGEAIPVFVIEPALLAPAAARAQPHRVQFLLDALAELQGGLAELGSRLVLVEGPAVDVVPELVSRWHARRVLAHASVDPAARERDGRVRAAGVRLDLYEGETLVPPGTVRTASGGPYWVYSAFARAFGRQAQVERPRPAPAALPRVPDDVPAGAPLPDLRGLGVTRNPRLQTGGESAGHERLVRFLKGRLEAYAEGRDRLDVEGTSRLSADLRFGTLSARTVWAAAAQVRGEGAAAFRRELVWREFTHGALHERPALLAEPFRPEFATFPWADPREGWEAWAAGRTGYPLVDAAARQLLAEGFVHNRARMIAASFLTKHLRIDYRLGEAHYMRHLTDGDPANNNAGWQWSAGCGLDAQPWFRIFNPVRQGARFDPEGAYVRRWMGELADLPARWIHRPWEAPPAVLAAAGVRLGESYPERVVELDEARDRYLRIARAHLGGARAARTAESMG